MIHIKTLYSTIKKIVGGCFYEEGEIVSNGKYFSPEVFEMRWKFKIQNSDMTSVTH